MTDLDKAREWAEQRAHSELVFEGAAARLIQSLPDRWVDVEKLKAIIADMDHCLKMETTSDFSKGIDNATTSWRDALKALIAPKLPTLADMTQEEREACKWMQVKTWCEVGILVWVDEDSEIAEIITQNNGALERKFKDVTPLTGEPKLEWPGNAPQEPYLFGGTSSESDLPDMSVSERMETPKSSIKPEDVPPNEPWLIEANGTKAIGTRYKGDAVLPWFVAALDGSFADDYHDSVVTLIHKLVAEPPALPEGMRLADERTLGRVMVTTEFDSERTCEIIYWNNALGRNCPGFADESDITFLDGGN